MAANSSQVPSVTEPEKPKLDDGDKDEAETKETLESAKPGTSTESGDDYIDSDDDLAHKLCPQDFESGELVELCELALAHYQVEHPGESYKFESGHGGYWMFNMANEYHLEFCAKKADDNSIQNFEASALYYPYDEPENFIVEKCFLLKHGEEEPMGQMEKMGMDLGQNDELSLKDLEEKEYKEYAKIVEFCKSALTFYEEHSGESYEFVGIQKVKRSVFRGFEYILVFHAKKKADSTPATFKAYAYNLVRAIEIMSCELR